MPQWSRSIIWIASPPEFFSSTSFPNPRVIHQARARVDHILISTSSLTTLFQIRSVDHHLSAQVFQHCSTFVARSGSAAAPSCPRGRMGVILSWRRSIARRDSSTYRGNSRLQSPSITDVPVDFSVRDTTAQNQAKDLFLLSSNVSLPPSRLFPTAVSLYSRSLPQSLILCAFSSPHTTEILQSLLQSTSRPTRCAPPRSTPPSRLSSCPALSPRLCRLPLRLRCPRLRHASRSC